MLCTKMNAVWLLDNNPSSTRTSQGSIMCYDDQSGDNQRDDNDQSDDSERYVWDSYVLA